MWLRLLMTQSSQSSHREEWLQRTANYPASENINMGHRRDDYIVPFIPLCMHNMMFKQLGR